jgi:hypothetical protein
MNRCSAELRHLSLHISIISCTVLITDPYIYIRSLIFWKFLTQRRRITRHQERRLNFFYWKNYKAQQMSVSAVFVY